MLNNFCNRFFHHKQPGHVAQSVGHLTRKSGVLENTRSGNILSFLLPLFKKGSCQLLAKVYARSTG